MWIFLKSKLILQTLSFWGCHAHCLLQEPSSNSFLSFVMVTDLSHRVTWPNNNCSLFQTLVSPYLGCDTFWRFNANPGINIFTLPIPHYTRSLSSSINHSFQSSTPRTITFLRTNDQFNFKILWRNVAERRGHGEERKLYKSTNF